VYTVESCSTGKKTVLKMAVIMVFSDDISGILEDVGEHLSEVGTILR